MSSDQLSMPNLQGLQVPIPDPSSPNMNYLFNGKDSKFRLTLLLFSIILLAAFLRLYRLPALPPGLNFDEAGNGVAALDILQGAPKLWWRIGGGKEPLWPYLIALSTAIWDNLPLTLRLPAAWVGTLTVAAVYPLTYRLFRAGGRDQARLVAILAMLGLSLSEWHLHFSRLGFRAILLPFLSALGFYFFWCAVSDSTSPLFPELTSQPLTPNPKYPPRFKLSPLQLYLFLSAFCLALAIYAYLAARLLPLVPLLFWVLFWLNRYLRPRHEQFEAETSTSLPVLPFWLIAELFAALIFFLLPFIIYFVFNPADFAARSTTVSILNPDWNNGDLLGTTWRTLTATLGTFVGLDGDANPLLNLPGQPAIPFMLTPFFALGVGISCYRSIRSSASHLFLIYWWVIMLLPAVLAPEGAPHHLRLIGTIIPSTIFVALGLATALNWLRKLLTSGLGSPLLAHRLSYLLPALCFLPVAFQTYTHYFLVWPTRTDFTLPFDVYALQLADAISQGPPEAVYVLPMDIRAGPGARHYTLDYLLADQPASYVYLPVDEHNAETILSYAITGKEELRVVRWTQDKHREADAKEIVTFLLETNSRLLGRHSFPVYNVESYALPLQPAFQLPPIDQLFAANFDGLLRLDAAFLPSTASPGDWLPVAITLSPQAPMEVDYKVSLRLVSPTGERVAQKDRALLHNFHQGTSLWPPGTVNEYYLLPVPLDVPPGNYTVSVLIYNPDTQTPLVVDSVVEMPLGQVRIGRKQ